MAKRILVADDDRAVARTVQMNLQRHGYEVVVANDGREVLKRLDSHPPDLIVLDVMMPCADGFEVLEVIRASPDTAGIPVIFLTARSSEEDISRGWRSGVDCYLTKPFDPAELLAFVRRMLDAPSDGAAS